MINSVYNWVFWIGRSLGISTLATSCEELTHWKRLWCWEGLGAGGEWDDRGWDGWMASPTRWMWVWVNSGSWWWTGRPGLLQFMGSQRVGHNWTTELNWASDSVAGTDKHHVSYSHTHPSLFEAWGILDGIEWSSSYQLKMVCIT